MNLQLKQKLSFTILIPALISLNLFFRSDFIFAQVTEEISHHGKLTIIVTGFNNDLGKCRFTLDNSKFVYESEDTVGLAKTCQ